MSKPRHCDCWSHCSVQCVQMVRVILDNVNNDLLADFNGRMMPPSSAYANRADVVRFTSKVTAVLKNPPRIQLERAIPFNISTGWKPEIHQWVSGPYGVKRNFTGASDLTVRCVFCLRYTLDTNIDHDTLLLLGWHSAAIPGKRATGKGGVTQQQWLESPKHSANLLRATVSTPLEPISTLDHLNACAAGLCRFPPRAWAGENKDEGFNGFYFFACSHSWVRNVHFENADFGLAFDVSEFNSVQNVHFTSTRPTNPKSTGATIPTKWTGGKGIWLKVRPALAA